MVSIRLIVNGGIIGRANNGVKAYSDEEVQEQIKLAYAEWQTAQWPENEEDAATFIKNRLKIIFKLEDDEISVDRYYETLFLLIKDKQYLYEVNTGEVNIGNWDYVKENQVLWLDAKINYKEHGQSSDIWYDLSNHGKNAIKTAGTTQWNEKSLILDGSTYYTVDAPVNNSLGTVEVCVKIDSSFLPRSSNVWYWCSTIFGCELGGLQRDWAIVIDKNGNFAIGYDVETIYSSNISAKDGKIHTISYSYLKDKLVFTLDGKIITQIDYTPGGSTCKQFGIGYNKSSGNTAIKGNIYSVRFYDKELTQEELKTNYNIDKLRFGVN